MKLSEDRISSISHQIHDRLYLDEYVDYTDEDEALRAIKRTIANYLKIDDEMDSVVIKKIRSLKKGVIPGSLEWEILYKKYFAEELIKKRQP